MVTGENAPNSCARMKLASENRASGPRTNSGRLGEPGEKFAGTEWVGEQTTGIWIRILAYGRAEQLAVQGAVIDVSSVEL